jgi:hypothetical protein
MPERVTKEERMVTLAIEKARLAKEKLSDKKRMNIEPTQVNPVDTTVEVQKITRPKVQDASKITNQTQEKEGYGLAGETLKKRQIDRPSDSGKIKAQEKLIAYFKSAYMPALRTYSMMNEEFEKEVMEDANKVLKHLEDDLKSLKTQEKMFDDPKYRRRRNLG